jgi:4-hydroxy-3-polyprenylbenzoate decarboxylase
VPEKLESVTRFFLRPSAKGPADVFDHATSEIAMGTKLGIDATRKWASEGFARPWPDEIVMDPATKARIDVLWKSLQL